MDTVIDIKNIKGILPHEYPFLFIDKVISLQRGPKYPTNREGGKIVAVKNVTINEEFFKGHFPHRPVMPGVLVVESMAQACALLAYRPEGTPQDVALAGINKAKFRRAVGPGDTLMIHGNMVKDRGSFVIFDCSAYVDDQLVAEAEIVAKLFDRED